MSSEIRRLIREFVLLELEEDPERKKSDPNELANDSIDLQIDSSIAGFDKSAKGRDGGLDMQKFASDIAIMIDHVQDQLDLKSAVVRRVANYLTKAYDEKVSNQVLQILEDSFDLSTDVAYRKDAVDDRVVPVSKIGGPPAGGGAT